MSWDVGLVGLGVIGHIFAGHLFRVTGRLSVFDVNTERMDAVCQAGPLPCKSSRELAERSRVIVISLPNPVAVQAAITGAEGILQGAAPGTLIIDTSTVDPQTNVEMYEACRRAGVAYLDAPVSGGEKGGAGMDGARHATLTFMVGGDADAFDRALPVMEVLGKHFFYLGPPGSGSTVKLISNLIAGLNNLVAAEGLLLGAAAGFEPETLLKVFDDTDAKSFLLTDYMTPRLRRRDFVPGFSIDLQYKDHRLAAELARRLGVPLIFNGLAVAVYELIRAQGSGGNDIADVLNSMGKMLGADVFEPRASAQASDP